MKCTVLTSAIVLSVMLACPLHLLGEQKSAELPASTQVENIPSSTVAALGYDSFSVLIDGAVTKLSATDYIRGVVAAEMPALYETEALKAQAIAAYTFACYRKSTKGDAEYDITADSKTDQAYISDAAAREKWGEKAEEYLNKIQDAVCAVEGMLLTYNGECALSVYHAISSGTTASCKDVWGKDLPYLVGVTSVGDTLDTNYLTTANFSEEELATKLSELTEIDGKPQDWFKNLKVADCARVISLELCQKQVSGQEIANLLGLRSANFEISYGNGTFTFTVRGYGHGVGMSQVGANYMAKQGSSYKEILCHYYTGCEIAKG